MLGETVFVAAVSSTTGCTFDMIPSRSVRNCFLRPVDKTWSRGCGNTRKGNYSERWNNRDCSGSHGTHSKKFGSNQIKSRHFTFAQELAGTLPCYSGGSRRYGPNSHISTTVNTPNAFFRIKRSNKTRTPTHRTNKQKGKGKRQKRKETEQRTKPNSTLSVQAPTPSQRALILFEHTSHPTASYFATLSPVMTHHDCWTYRLSLSFPCSAPLPPSSHPSFRLLAPARIQPPHPLCQIHPCPQRKLYPLHQTLASASPTSVVNKYSMDDATSRRS